MINLDSKWERDLKVPINPRPTGNNNYALTVLYFCNINIQENRCIQCGTNYTPVRFKNMYGAEVYAGSVVITMWIVLIFGGAVQENANLGI